MNLDLRQELSKLGFFDESILAEQDALLASATSHTYRPGDVLYQSEGDSKLLFIIRQGLVKLLAYLPNGRTRIVRMHKRGSLIGFDGLMDQSHSHTAVEGAGQVEQVQRFASTRTPLAG